MLHKGDGNVTSQGLPKVVCRNPGDRLSRRKFEILRPRNVKTQSHAWRMVCGCTLHTNVDFIRNCMKRIIKINKINSNVFDPNSNLVDYMCENQNLTCLLRKCQTCGPNKLNNFDIKYCSLKCSESGSDCSLHCVKFLQYEQTEYTRKGVVKKKVGLVDKHIPVSEILDHLKLMLVKFALHRFNVQHTKDQMDLLQAHWKEDEIIKVQDFSENYKCLLPNEIQSMHWVQPWTT